MRLDVSRRGYNQCLECAMAHVRQLHDTPRSIRQDRAMNATGRLLAVVLLLLSAACSSSPATSSSPDVTLELDGRPFRLHVPGGYDAATKAPPVVLLHGYTSS